MIISDGYNIEKGLICKMIMTLKILNKKKSLNFVISDGYANP